MGFDLVARREAPGADDYYRAGIEFMGFLRVAMTAAGVDEALVYRKFVSNDNLLVTARESATIATRLTEWLRGRALIVDLVEADPRGHIALDALRITMSHVGLKRQAGRVARQQRLTSRPVRIDRAARRALRRFAAFCEGSGGFYVS